MEETNDKFLDMFLTSQTCDFCQNVNREILLIIIHPIYRCEGNPVKQKLIGYSAAKKCKKCCEVKYKKNRGTQ